MTNKTPSEVVQDLITAHFPSAVYANMTERQKECLQSCVAAAMLFGISQIADGGENSELKRAMAKDAAEFEKTLDPRVNTKYFKSSAYPWGWCYEDGEVQRQFREFCISRKRMSEDGRPIGSSGLPVDKIVTHDDIVSGRYPTTF